MAEVFAGSTVGAEGFSRKVAIKRVRPGFSDDPGFAQLFIAEAQISARLVHPNIVSVLDFDRDPDGSLFLVMELVDGKDLDAVLATGLLPLPVVIFVLAEILRGLGFAHDPPSSSGLHSVVHRDASPHNVLVSWEGAVKVSDFGIAKARAASSATASTLIKGKPAYMSPEQANGEPLDGRSDLFAAGTILWEMLVGQQLFTGPDPRAILTALLFHPIPRPRAVRPDVPRDLDRITMKLLERDLPARYATAEAAIADLMNCADAPRAGREALTAVLAERFPGDAPVRRNSARALSRGDAPTPPGPIPTGTPTLTGAPAGPGFTDPGLGTLRSAPTATLGAPPRRILARVLVPLALLITSGVVTFAIVSAVRNPTASAPRTDNSLGSATTANAPAPGALSRAAITFQPSATRPIDAGAAVTPKPAAIAVQSSRPDLDKPTGSLYVVGLPTLSVTIDGTFYGTTPLTIPLRVGTHRVRLQNAGKHIDEVVPAVITEHQTTTLDRMPQ